jgi:hypothetical protein
MGDIPIEPDEIEELMGEGWFLLPWNRKFQTFHLITIQN